jgi:hypothetical protein
MRMVAIVLGLALVAIAIAYWALPAGSLPRFFPGFERGSPQVHVKHGIVAAVAAVLLLGYGWYAGRSRA